MTATTPIAVATAFLALALAGCTGSFNVDQTEPIRVQLEGGPETVTVRDTDAEAKRVQIATDCETTCDHEEVEVQLEVHKVSSGPCKVLVTIQDQDGRTITSRVIDVDVTVDGDGGDDDGDDGTTTTGNTTGNATTTSASGTGSTSGVTIQNIVVNVKGNKNIIVLTQAQEGSADVNVQAIKATGNANVDSDVDQGDDDDAMTSSSTTTSSGNMTTTYP